MAQKTGKVIVPTEPASRAMTITGFTFKSYDKKAGVLQFEIKNQDGSPTDLIDATVRLFMYIYQGEEKKEFPIFDNQIITESYMQGIVKYRIPDILLSYEGKVDANVYIDFPDGSHTDNLAFTFNIEKSIIDGDVQLNGEYYFKDFQQLLDGVKQEATDAVNEVLEHANQKITEYDQKFQQTAQNIATLDQNFTELRNDMKLSEAWAWSKDGTDRFTDKYPIDNLLPNSMFNSQMGWTASMLDVGSTQSGIANGEAWLEDLTATTSRWKQWQIYFDNNRYPDTFELIKANPNKRVTVSVDAKVEGNTIKHPGIVDLSLRSSTGDNWVNLRVDETKISSEYIRYTAIGTLPSDFNNVQNFRLILTFNGNGRATFTKPKLAIGNDGFYTPAPSEDYENAYPDYIGLALAYSDKPEDYLWLPEPTKNQKKLDELIKLKGQVADIQESLNNTVSLTEPQSIEGLKNFEDGLQIAGKEVATVPEDTGWVNLTAINGHSWNKQGQIRRIGKLVMFRGSLKGSTLSTQDFCTIPEGFRPSNPTDNYEYQFLLPPQSSNTLDNGGMAYIRPNGVCGLPSFRGTVNLFLAPIQYYID